MSSDPTLWMLVFSNIFVFVIGGSLTYYGFRAQRRVGKPNLKYATLGFGFVTLSTIAEVIYSPAVIGIYNISGSSLLILYTIESLLIGLGLASIYYSVRGS
ncbi:MAG: hypothetical protein J07HQX50_01631 [Haloquadratum sp. J07HQX50]|jgi:hypothetical protein|nr:MAG: hypothetical protein J07HQX50_01631 [Haloquadratum sp. J07HQX50]